MSRQRIDAAISGSAVPWADAERLIDIPEACLLQSGCAGGSACPSIYVAMNGFLCNPDELSARLGAGRDAGPGRLVALAFDRWRDRAPAELHGEFAAVAYHAEERRTFLVRDHIGTRPLYWHLHRGLLSLATLIADLLAILNEPVAPDEESIVRYLRRPGVLGSRTLLKDIHAVEPGSLVVVDAGGARATRWWPPEAVPEVRFSAVADYADAGRDLVERAVAARVSGSKPIGSHLSGGLDSTTVTIIAQDQLRARGECLTAAYSWSPGIGAASPEMTPRDERRRVLAICNRAGLPARFGALDGIDLRAFLARPMELEGLADVADEFAILSQAAADGIGVMLSGWGGDEAFSAHAHGVPAWRLARGHLRELGWLARRSAGLRRPARTLGFLWTFGILPLLPDSLFARFGPYRDIHRTGSYLCPSLKTRNVTREGAGRFTADPISDVKHALLHGHIGERMATWAAWGAPFGVEYRYPLADRRLLEFVLGLPPEILWGDGSSRFLARHTLAGRDVGKPAKSDPANERKRAQALHDCWILLSRDAREGKFAADCPWLDMPRLRQDVLQGPSGDKYHDGLVFACIEPAVRIWHMAQRFGVNV